MKKLLGIVVLGLLWCNVGFAELIKIPVYVHIMDIQKDDFKTKTKESDIIKDFQKVNEIWSQADIFFEIKNINFTKPKLSGFKKYKKFGKLKITEATTPDTRSSAQNKTGKQFSEYLIRLTNSQMHSIKNANYKKGTLNPNGINVFYMPHIFGVACGWSINPRKQVIKIKRYMGFTMISHVCKDRPHIVAHELGHQFSLLHEGQHGKDLMMYGSGTYISTNVKKMVHKYYNDIYKPIKFREWTYKK